MLLDITRISQLKEFLHTICSYTTKPLHVSMTMADDENNPTPYLHRLVL